MTSAHSREIKLETPARRWPLFLGGILLFIVGPVAYFVQMQIPRFDVPWYLPILSTLGVLLMQVSVWRRGLVWQKIVVLLFLIVCGLEWFFFLEFTKTPPYTGPAQVGQKLPAFAATRANGKAFTQSDLASGNRTAVIFYRGHW